MTKTSAKALAATPGHIVLARHFTGHWMEPAVQMELGVAGGNVYLMIGLQELLV